MARSMAAAVVVYLLAALQLTAATTAAAYSTLTIIDGENVRGKSSFSLKHEELVNAVEYWTVAQQHNNNHHYASLVIDHGAKPSAFYHPLPTRSGPRRSFAILFSGPNEKADDVIARDVGRIASAAASGAAATDKTLPVLPHPTLDLGVIRVVTSDQGLRSRCRLAFEDALGGYDSRDGGEYKRRRNTYRNNNRKKRSGGNKLSANALRLEFVPSFGFLSQLERELLKAHTYQYKHHPKPALDASSPSSPSSYETIKEALHEDIEIRGKLYQIECGLRDVKRLATAEKRRTLVEQGRKISEKLDNLRNANGQTLLDRAISSDNADIDVDDGVKDSFGTVLSNWDASRREAGRAELTGDRMVLSEHLRSLLDERLRDEPTPPLLGHSPFNDNNPSAFHFMCHHNFHNVQDRWKAEGKSCPTVSAFDMATEELRLVVVSDTSASISPSSKPLPSGDVFLHLGNFTPDSNQDKRRRKETIAEFDKWLSDQPHPIKLVLRGGLDPPDRRVALPLSRAIFVDMPRTVSLGGGNFILTLVPHCSERILNSSWRRLPHTFDVLVSHDNPVFRRQAIEGGSMERPTQCSQMLADKVDTMFSGPPCLWFGGSISLGVDASKTMLATTSTSMRDTTILRGREHSAVPSNERQEGNTHHLVIDMQKKATSSEIQFKVLEDIDLAASNDITV